VNGVLLVTEAEVVLYTTHAVTCTC